MKTRKGGNLATRFGRAIGIYHGPSTSNLMRNFLEIYGQPYVNVRPIVKEWTVEKIMNGKSILLLDSRYEYVFVEIYCKVFNTYNDHFSVIHGFKEKVDKFKSEKSKEDNFLIETLTLHIQKYVKQGKKIPANVYDWIMDWIDYMESFKPSTEIVNLKRAMKGHRSDVNDPKWDAIFILPNAPPKHVRTGGDPDPIHVAPDPIVIEIFLTIIVFLIKFFVVILSGGMVNPF